MCLRFLLVLGLLCSATIAEAVTWRVTMGGSGYIYHANSETGETWRAALLGDGNQYHTRYKPSAADDWQVVTSAEWYTFIAGMGFDTDNDGTLDADELYNTDVFNGSPGDHVDVDIEDNSGGGNDGGGSDGGGGHNQNDGGGGGEDDGDEGGAAAGSGGVADAGGLLQIVLDNLQAMIVSLGGIVAIVIGGYAAFMIVRLALRWFRTAGAA